jgi:hypothetical protein
VNIRTYRPGDEAKQAALWNAVAAVLPGFKPASEDDVLRRTHARDFDPATRFYAEEDGQVIGYAMFQQNGRVSCPWCLPGKEATAVPLLDAVLEAMRSRGIARAFTAYRGDWTPVAEFFLANGFTKSRDVLNFVQNIMDLPTMVNRRSLSVTPFRPTDVPALMNMVPGFIKMPIDQLEAYLLWNPYFGADSLFTVRNPDGSLRAVALLVEDRRYADPKMLDAKAPCFRLGAFGTEGMTTKRINGLFSFVTAPGKEANPMGLDLLWYAATVRLENSDLETIAAQVPSDVPHLVSFYQSYFRPQGSFPIFERSL